MTKKSELSYEELKRRLEAAETTIQALQASETRLRLIFENAFDGISIHEEIPEKRSRRLIDCNTRYAEMAGRPKKELLRLENTGKLQRKLDRSRSTEENRRLREEKTPYRGIFSWIRPDREENVIEYTAVPIEAKDRPLTIGIDRDITEKVNAKKEREDAVRALEESQRQLSSLLSNLPGMAYRCLNEPAWPMSFVSEGCRELTGYAPTEMTNSEYPQYGDLIHPADKQRVWDTIQEAVDADAHFTLEYRIRIKGSEERWVWERGHVVPKQGSESTHLEGFISDITERKLAEEDLRLFKAIVENSSEAIAISDPEGILVYINEAHEKLFGRSLEEATQANYRDFYPPDSVEILNQEVAPALARGDSWEGELDVYDAAGRRFPLWERADSIRDAEGNLSFAFGLMHDVSEQREMELQREAIVEALRESEEKYRTLFEEALNPIMLVNREGQYIDANQAALDFLECGRDTLLSKDVWDFTPPNQLERQQQEHAPFVERRTLETDYDVHGSIKTLLLNVVPFEMEGKTILYGIGQDITARKQNEQALRESEARYRTLFETANDAIFLMEGDTFIECNEAAVRMFGCEDKADILDHTPWVFSSVIQPDGCNSKRASRDHIRAALNGDAQHFEWKHARKDGSPFDTEVSLNRLYLDDKTFLLAIVRDITERRDAERERLKLTDQIREQARQLVHILETVPAGVLLLDTEGRILVANPVAEQAMAVLTDAPSGEILTHLGNRSLSDLLTSPPTQGLWHEVTADTELGTRIFEVIAMPVANGPEPEQWVLVINEVTKEREIRKQYQRQAQLAAIGQLAAGIAHDFNNIIAVIVLYTQMGLRSSDLSDKLRERLEVIDQQARRATDLIQQIVDFGGRAVLKRQPVDLVAFLKEMIRLLQRTIPEHISIRLTYEPASYTVNADPTRLQQMLTNLTINARDAMPNGGSLHIGLSKLNLKRGQLSPKPEMEPGPWIRLTVSDTGNGISPNVLPHIFKPFYTTKDPGEGTGLGLAQVHGIVNQHGGAIDVETKTGEGTTFTIYLPAIKTKLPAPSQPESQSIPKGHGEVILVVEDEAMVRAALVESLIAWDYKTLQAANGQEALACIDAHRDDIDIVLSDVVMPTMGGIPLFHTLKEREPNLPVIMLSGHPMESELKDLEEEGLAGWMLKPPKMAALARLLDQALRESDHS